MTKHYIDFDGLAAFLTRASDHYAESAPQVETYLDDLMIRLIEDTTKVTAHEIINVARLFEDDEWLAPAGATNFCLHTMNTLGMDTSGIME